MHFQLLIPRPISLYHLFVTSYQGGRGRERHLFMLTMKPPQGFSLSRGTTRPYVQLMMSSRSCGDTKFSELSTSRPQTAKNTMVLLNLLFMISKFHFLSTHYPYLVLSCEDMRAGNKCRKRSRFLACLESSTGSGSEASVISTMW